VTIDYNDAGPWGRYDPNRVITTRPFDEVLEEAAAEDGVPIGPQLRFECHHIVAMRHPHR